MHYLETFPKSGTVEVLDIFFKKLPLLLRLTDFSRTSFCSSVDTNVSQRNSFPFALAEQNKTGSPAEEVAKPGSRRAPWHGPQEPWGWCPHRTHGAFRSRQSQVPGTNPKCFTATLAAALRPRKGSFTSALCFSRASRSANLPLWLPKHNRPATRPPPAPQMEPGEVAPQQDPGLWQGCSPPPAAPQPGAAGSLISQASPNSHSLHGLLLWQEKTGRLLSCAALWGAPIHLFKEISKRAATLLSPLSSPGLTMG